MLVKQNINHFLSNSINSFSIVSLHIVTIQRGQTKASVSKGKGINNNHSLFNNVDQFFKTGPRGERLMRVTEWLMSIFPVV